jgi:peptide/nickel transport system substrate-binding protein
MFKVISTTDPTTVRTLMSRRELEIIDEWQSVENLRTLAKVQGITVPLLYTGALANLEMNTKIAPTDDIHFRKALAYLFPYEEATTNVYSGTKQAVGPVSSAYEGHDPTLFQYSFDIEKAREELKLSKYFDKLDEYPITITWSADVPDEEKLSLLLQQSCAEVGITLEIQKATFPSIIQQAAEIETTSHITIMYPSDSYSEAGSVLALRYHSNTAGSFTQFEWLQDKEIDAAIEKALSTVDKESRLSQYREIQKKLVEICPTIWVLEWPEMRAYQSGYVNWPEAEAAKDGTLNCPVMGRSLYFRTMEVFPEKREALLNGN